MRSVLAAVRGSALFSAILLLPIAFVLILTPTVRDGNRSRWGPLSLALSAAALLAIAWLWGSLILDQMPCFLGVPDCD